MPTPRIPRKAIGPAVFMMVLWLAGSLTNAYAGSAPGSKSGSEPDIAGRDGGVTQVRGISVRGTDEYPKVFNIVPWQTPTLTRRARPKLKADLGGLLKPVSPRVLERQRNFRKTLHLVNPEQGID